MYNQNSGWGRSEAEEVLGYNPDTFVKKVQEQTNQSEQDILLQLKQVYDRYPVVFGILGFVALAGLIAHLLGSDSEKSENYVLEVIIYDVKHGNFAFIRTPDGTQIVQDLGQGSYGDSSESWSPLKNLKNNWDVNSLDYAIVTHPDLDHIEDILNLEDFNPTNFLRPTHLPEDIVVDNIRDSDREIFEEYVEFDKLYRDPIHNGKLELEPTETGGVNIKSFQPSECGTSKFNNHSIVTVLEYGDNKIVLPGDNEAPSWRELLERDDFKEAIEGTDVFMASHHGREDGFCEDIFEYFNPKLTVVSDGEHGDTSATGKYNGVTDGWKVHRRNGESERREVVSTRKDGVVYIKVGYNEENSYIEVNID